MKIRQGFVSNSSSSSFIVGFERLPLTQEELKDMMFPLPKNAGLKEIDGLPIDAIVARVWSDIHRMKPITSAEIDEELSGGYLFPHIQTDYTEVREIDEKYKKVYGVLSRWSDHEDWYEEHRAASGRAWEDYDKRIEAEVQKFKKENWKKLGLAGKIIFCFSYSDNEGEEALEHGGIFEDLPHIQISHH